MGLKRPPGCWFGLMGVLRSLQHLTVDSYFFELSVPVSVISFSLVGGDMLHGKGYHHGLVGNQILTAPDPPVTLYDRM